MLPGIFAALWLPAWISASHSWTHGEYYQYGWFVPPAAMFLFCRRLDFAEPIRPPGKIPLTAGCLGILLAVTVLRILSYADPSWRLPVVGLGLFAAAAGHLLLATAYGWKRSLQYGLITALLLSAIPWPMFMEKKLVDWLTTTVIHTVAEIFPLAGRPVEVLGDRLQLNELTVEVTDGCSGVRSFQSFIMASFFFAELQRLSWFRTAILLLCGCLAAFAVNTARTYALAEIRFEAGEEAFHKAHDWLGLLAFLISATFFYLISGKLSEQRPRQVVRTVKAS